ncbi:MAG: MaoC family dehydratase N-terminal domain-containing protein [Betaproteobacteria bacterium]|nr:MaoC family dehydratase N-terminal domain-containing protein [Betaproteobacteria bacterium]
MSILPEAAKAYIGVQTETEIACERVERGAVRRYAIYPMFMFYWREFGRPDPVQEHARDPDFDGTVGLTGGLPDIAPLKHLSVLNGGSEIEFYRYARHGETVKLRARYVDLIEKQSSKGPMILVISESDYLNGDDELLLRVRRTQIRR